MKQSVRKLVFLLGITFLCIDGFCQNFAIKSNLLYDATTTINLGVEFALTDRWTIDISGNYNPWSFPQKEKNSAGVVVEEYDTKIKHWMVQPELRWWTCEKFQGHFFGIHAHYGQFDVGGLSFLPEGWGDGWKDKNNVHHKDGVQYKRFDGWLVGSGLSYGYQWVLSSRFTMEFSIGGGYSYLKYDKYPRHNSAPKEAKKYMHYIGLSKAGITAVFMLK